MRNRRSLPLPFTKLILFLGFLSMVSQTFGQQRQPELIAFGEDTLVGISQQDFDVVLFSFSYLRSVENTLDLTSEQLSRQIDITTYLNEQLTLERLKSTETDSIVMNLETVVDLERKDKNKVKRKRDWTIGGLVAIIVALAAERGVNAYQQLTK